MIIKEITPLAGGFLRIVDEEGRSGTVDVTGYFDSPAFSALKENREFSKVHNGKYFVEWDCGADLSADTLEARMKWDAEGAEALMVAEDSGEYKTK